MKSPAPVIALRREPGPLVRSLTALVLRLALGLILLVSGLDKYFQMHPAAAPLDSPIDLDAPQEPAGSDSDIGTDLNLDLSRDPDPPVDLPPSTDPCSPQDPPADLDPPTPPESDPEPPPDHSADADADADAAIAPANPDGAGGAAGPPRYPDSIRGMFAGTWLNREFPWAIDLFTAALPYAEIALGAALILGWFTTLAAFLTGMLLVKLLFGWLVLGQADMYPNMLAYLLVDAGVLWLSPVTSNYISIDGLIAGWFWSPRGEGRYLRDEAPPEPRSRR